MMESTIALLNRQHAIMDMLAEARIEIARELCIDPKSVMIEVVKDGDEAVPHARVEAAHIDPVRVATVSTRVLEVTVALIKEQLADIESRRSA
jgi:hypothetical protein